MRKLRHTLNDVDQIVDDPPLRPHDQVKISKSDVEIHDDDGLAGGRKRGTKGGG